MVLWLWPKRASPLVSLESKAVCLIKKNSVMHVGVPKLHKLPGPVRQMDSRLSKLKSQSCYCIYYLAPCNFCLRFFTLFNPQKHSTEILVIPSISQMINTDSK